MELGWRCLGQVAFLCLACSAADAAETVRLVSYTNALEAAVAANPTLRGAEAAREGAEGGVWAAAGAFDPLYTVEADWRRSQNQGFFQGFPFTSTSETWSVNNRVSGTTSTATTYAVNAGLDRNFSKFVTDFGLGNVGEQEQKAFTSNLNFSITQELLRGIRFKYNLQNVTRQRQALTTAELQLERTKQETLYLAAEAYWNWVYQVTLEEIAQNSVDAAAEALRVGNLQVELGQLAPVEGTRLEAAMVASEQSQIDAHNAAEAAANALLLIMGQSPGDTVSPSTDPGDVPELDLDVDQAIQVALQQNLDLAVSRQALETAEFDLGNAKHGRLPTLNATVSAGVAAQDVDGSSAVGGLFDADNQPFTGLGGVFSVPLGNRSARGEQDRTQATVTQRQVELEAQERQISATVEEQVRLLASARRRMELADVQLRLAEETLAAEEALSAAGRSIQKDVLEARSEVERTRAEAAKARTDRRLALVQLRRLQGQLSETAP